MLVAPLADVLAASPGRGHELHAALSSMSDAVLAYRGMTAVRPRLLAELQAMPNVRLMPRTTVTGA